MNFTVEIDHGGKLIKISTSTLLDQQLRKEILISITSHINELQYFKVLIDLTQTSFKQDEPMTGALELAEYMKAIGIPRRARLAFVFSEAEMHRKFFAEIAASYGFQIQYFRELDDAMDWLDSEL